MKNAVLGFCINAGLIGAMVAGKFYGVWWANNIASTVLVILAILYALSAWFLPAEDLPEGRSIFGKTIGWTMAITAVALGWQVSGAIIMISALAIAGRRGAAKKQASAPD